jgi:dihydrolipoamide dehydrogenase
VTTGLNVEGVGLVLEKGYIRVDEEYRTSVPGISAVGDVITLGTPGHPQLAHVSSAEGLIAAERIAGRETRPINYDQVPGCTYCDPEIGSVGLTEREAKERGFDVRVGTFPFGCSAGRDLRRTEGSSRSWRTKRTTRFSAFI